MVRRRLRRAIDAVLGVPFHRWFAVKEFWLELTTDVSVSLVALIYMPLVALVGFVLGRCRSSRAVPVDVARVSRRTDGRLAHRFQNEGELLLTRVIQASFGAPDYHLMNHVTLRMSDGTTQVDHILVSRFGVFVIETKHRRGSIFASDGGAEWLQVVRHRQFTFQNPLRQNYRHVCAVRDILAFLPPAAIQSVVVFTGDAEFRTAVPDGVFDLSGVISYLRARSVQVMSLNRMQFCVGRLETARLEISRETDVEHIESLERRYGVAS